MQGKESQELNKQIQQSQFQHLKMLVLYAFLPFPVTGFHQDVVFFSIFELQECFSKCYSNFFVSGILFHLTIILEF